MNSTVLMAALGVAILALPALFVLGRRTGAAAEIRRLAAAKSTAEEARVLEPLQRAEDLIELPRVDVLGDQVAAQRLRLAHPLAYHDDAYTPVEEEEKRLGERETTLERKFDVLEQRDRDFSRRASEFGRREKVVVERESELDRLHAEQRLRLEQMAGMSAQEAKAELIRKLEEEAQADAANRLREIRERARRDAERERRSHVVKS